MSQLSDRVVEEVSPDVDVDAVVEALAAALVEGDRLDTSCSGAVEGGVQAAIDDVENDVFDGAERG